tara:strand:+ start:1017 stop:1349 length:333 start_codon:yes stop_codon:yes gene_type:complete
MEYEYEQSASPPEWFRTDESRLYFSATSGSSPFNEWYEFKDRADALKYIAEMFHSATFVDHFVWFQGEFYEYDQFKPESIETADDIEGYVLKDGAKVADLGDMIEAESPF